MRESKNIPKNRRGGKVTAAFFILYRFGDFLRLFFDLRTGFNFPSLFLLGTHVWTTEQICDIILVLPT